MKQFLDDLRREPEGFIGVTFLALMSILIFLQILFRYVFKLPLHWTEELARYLFIWLIYLGAILCIQWNRHLRIDIAINLFPEKYRGNIRKLGNIIFLIFCTVLFFVSLKVLSNIISSHQVSPAVQLPMYLVYLSVPVCCIGMFFRLVQVLRKGYTNKK